MRHRRLLLLLGLPGMIVSVAAVAVRTWHPAFASLHPNFLNHGATITLTGSDLDPPGWTRHLRYPLKYSNGSLADVTLANVGSSTQFGIVASKDMRGDSLRIEWVVSDTFSKNNPIPPSETVKFLPSDVVVQAGPDLTFVGTTVTPDLGPAFALMAVTTNGHGLVKGKYLRGSGMPTVTLGGVSRPVLTHQYEPRGSLSSTASCCQGGADAVYYTPPTQKASGWLVLDNSLGKDSMQVTFALPPAPSQVVAVTQTGTAALVPANVLQRGATYSVRGQHLSVVHAMPTSTSIKRGTVQLAGTSITPSFASDTNIVFTLPASFAASAGSLTVGTLMGSATVGTFNVIDPPIAINVTALGPVPQVITAARTYQFYASLGLPANPPKSGLGNLLVSTPGTPPGALKIKSVIPVDGSSVEVKVQGGDVQVSTPVNLRVAHESNGVNGQVTQVQQVSFVVRPPHPTSMTGPATVPSGSTQSYTITFDSTTSQSSSMVAVLSSSNPNLIPVPPTAALGGSKGIFDVSIPPMANASGSVTLSATLDGATASFPVTLRPPQPTQLVLSLGNSTTPSTSAAAGDMVRAEATFDGRLGGTSAMTNALSSSDTALTIMQAGQNAGVSQSGTSVIRHFRVSSGLSQQRSATVTISSGGATKTTTISLVPFQIASVSATPAGGQPGATLTATAIFSGALPSGHEVTFTSADTSKAVVTSSGTSVSSGATSKSASILLKGPVTSPRQVAFTVALEANNTIISTKVLLVTVTP